MATPLGVHGTSTSPPESVPLLPAVSVPRVVLLSSALLLLSLVGPTLVVDSTLVEPLGPIEEPADVGSPSADPPSPSLLPAFATASSPQPTLTIDATQMIASWPTKPILGIASEHSGALAIQQAARQRTL